MDYQGNYFPEEHDEHESKIYRTVKGIFKWTMYGISFVIYAIIIYLMFINRDSNILETNYMHKLGILENVDTDEIELYSINTPIFMNDDGSVQLHHVDYSDEYGLIELGIKYNANKITDGNFGEYVEYVLEDSNGNKYPIVNLVSDNGGRYRFERICFQGIDINLDANDLRFNNMIFGTFEPAFKTNNVEILRDRTEYTLSLYRKSNGELIHKFELYDNSVTFQRDEYEN